MGASSGTLLTIDLAWAHYYWCKAKKEKRGVRKAFRELKVALERVRKERSCTT